jgi:hypothetical protein
MLFMCVRLFMSFIRESLFTVFTKERLFMLLKFTCTVYKTWPVPVAAQSKVLVCGRSPAEIMGLNPTRGMDVCLL